MPRPGRGNGVPEKSKDFFGSMKRLIKNLSKWRVAMIGALVLAMISAILSLIAPNKLSDFTNVITEGIKPNTEVFEEIGTEMGKSFEKDFTTKMISFMNDKTISEEDKNAFMDTFKKMKQIEDPEEKQKEISNIPQSILEKIYDPITINGKEISAKDLAQFTVLSNNMDDLSNFDKMPKSIYDLVKPKIDMDKVKEYAIFLGTLYLVSALFSYIQNLSLTTVSNLFSKKLRSDISYKINRLPLKYFDNHETGDVLSRVTNDIDTVGHDLNNSLATLVTSVTLFIGSIIMMFVTNWVMAITAIVASLIGFGLMGLILGKSQKYFSERQKHLGELNGYIEEMYSGHNVVKAYNGDKLAVVEFDSLNEKLFNSNKKSQFLSGLMGPIMGFIGNLGYVAVCIVGALLALNGHITFGVIIAFIIYVRLFTNPLSQMAQAMTQLQSTVAASERVFDFIDEKEMTDESNLSLYLDPKKVQGNIEFKNVKFGYSKDKIIIKDFSAKVSPGNKIAIVGPTGAGKTTMVNLLMKFYEIDDGDILIDDVSIKDLTRENIHDLFCMVLQDTWLFEGSVYENIKFNKEELSEEEAWDKCAVVGVDHFIKTLPGGIHSLVDDSDTISSGQKQLLTIARGMVKNSPFLILDEATSNVDTRTEELVQQAMDKLTEGKTSFIIAHRLSTIKNADLILVMKDGNIIETGNHDELIEKNGFYAELYNSQFEETV